MEIITFDKEFVERTKTIVEQYCVDTFELNVTLLLNCLAGLVGLPIERTETCESSFKNACVAKLRTMGVIVKYTDDDKLFRTVKNALSHMYIHTDNQDKRIAKIILKDKKNRGMPEHTELHFTVAQLKAFALFVADQHLNRFLKYKTTT